MGKEWATYAGQERRLRFNLSHTWEWALHAVFSRLSLTNPKGQFIDETKRFGRKVTSCNLIVSSRFRCIHFRYLLLLDD